MRDVTPPGMSVPTYNGNFQRIAANLAPHGQERAGNLKSTQGYYKLCNGLDSAPSDSVITLVSFPSAKLEQNSSDSHPLKLMYEVESILLSYSKGIPCNTIPETFRFHIPNVYIFNLTS